METGTEGGGLAGLPPAEGEDVWRSLEHQIRASLESQKALASLAQEQVSFLSRLHSLVKDRASSPVRPVWHSDPLEPHLALGPQWSLRAGDVEVAAACQHARGAAAMRAAAAHAAPPPPACADTEGGAEGQSEEAQPEQEPSQGASAEEGQDEGQEVQEVAEKKKPKAVRVQLQEGVEDEEDAQENTAEAFRSYTAEFYEEALATGQNSRTKERKVNMPSVTTEEVITWDDARELCGEENSNDDLVGQDSLALGVHMRAKKTFCPVVELSHYNNYGRSNGDLDEFVDMPSIWDGIRPWVRAVCVNTLGWRFFEPTMCIIIALNAANIGWTIDRELRREDTAVQELNENIFLGIFIIELGLRLYVKGFRCLKVPANAFDCSLVVITVMTQVIKPLLDLWGGEAMVMFLEQVMVLRMMRMLRLARAVRLVASFRSLWKLVQGLVHSCTTMVSAMMLMFIIIYIFACFGAEFISKTYMDDGQVGHIISSNFSSLPHVVLTLFQFISMDSTAGVYMPLIVRNPWLAAYFLLILVIVAIALMNLITALLVEDAISSAQMDEEMKGFYTRQKLKQLTPALQELFGYLDSNGDGYVQAKEVVDSIRRGLVVPVELQDFINPARMLDLFEALDSDNSGDLSETEFVDGLCCVAVADVPRETMQILHLLRLLRKEIRNCRVNGQSIFRQHGGNGSSHYIAHDAPHGDAKRPGAGHDEDDPDDAAPLHFRPGREGKPEPGGSLEDSLPDDDEPLHL